MITLAWCTCAGCGLRTTAAASLLWQYYIFKQKNKRVVAHLSIATGDCEMSFRQQIMGNREKYTTCWYKLFGCVLFITAFACQLLNLVSTHSVINWCILSTIASYTFFLANWQLNFVCDYGTDGTTGDLMHCLPPKLRIGGVLEKSSEKGLAGSLGRSSRSLKKKIKALCDGRMQNITFSPRVMKKWGKFENIHMMQAQTV